MHKIVEGSASRSYGIHVAKLAGIPKKLLENAENKLKQLESGENITFSIIENKTTCSENQMTFFDLSNNRIVDKIKSIDIMDITPSQAIKILEDLKGEIEK